jgi:hypothetical protein
VSRLPRLCSRALGFFGTRARFDAYLEEACGLVGQVDAVLQGAEPLLQPEPGQAIMKEAPAMSAPSALPAMTSLG